MHLHQELEGYYLGLEPIDMEQGINTSTRSYAPQLEGCTNGLMIVEDFDSIRALLAHHFQGHGYGVCSAATVRDALAIAGDEHPRVIIVDYDMLGEDATKAVTKLRGALPTSYIVLMGGPGTADVEFRAKSAGASTVLAKAYRISELDRIVDAASTHDRSTLATRFDHNPHVVN